MTTTTQTSGRGELPSRAEFWAFVQRLVDTGLFPDDVHIHPSRISLRIEMPHNDRRSVDRALRFLGVPLAGLSDRVVSVGEPLEFRGYGYYYDGFKHLLLPGVDVGVFCIVLTQADASEHWSGSVRAGCPDHVCHCGKAFAETAELSTVSA